MSEPSKKLIAGVEVAEIPGSALTVAPVSRWHHARDWLLDCFSSIMVKEARQALKSYQFFITYTIVIASVAVWTLLMFFSETTGNVRPDWEKLSENLFYGYCMILGVPLCLIVPFSAFRSLAREYEDGTIQLISITTMKPSQIVLGKLSTAMLQMVIYLSVIAPCIALTYMLDAISYPLIAFTLLIAVGGSIFLTILGLLLAGASRSYALGMGISVFFVLGLGGLYLGWWELIDNMLTGYGFNAADFQRPEAQVALYGMAAFIGSIALVMLTAAAAQISFESDNRSTAIRIAMLVQLALFLSLIVMVSPMMQGQPQPVFAIAIFCGHFWLIVGCMLVSERPGLSNRVQRKLPKTWFGRSLFSLLMPGPGRGYLFAVSCMLASILAAAAIVASSDWMGIQPMNNFNFRGAQSSVSVEVLIASVLSSLYPLFFLSLIYLWMIFLRRFTRLKSTGALGPFIGLLSGGFLVSAVSIGAYTLWYNFERINNIGYYSAAEPGFLSCFNWYLAITTIGNNVFSSGFGMFWQNLIFFGPFAVVAILTTFVAVILAIRELRYQPTSAPVRVTKEIERVKAERKAATAAPAGESIDEIFGVLPDQQGREDAK
jgi:hypothetical protein